VQRTFRLVSAAASGLSIASAAIASLFSVLMLLQPCLGSYRQQHPQLDIILDSLGLPAMSSVLAMMTWRLAKFGRDPWDDSFHPGDYSFIRVWLVVLLFWGGALSMVAGGSLLFAVTALNRYAEIWSYCR
jgi:hypothetical protein